MESEDPASFVLLVDLQVSQGPRVEKTRPIGWPWHPWIVANQAPLSMGFHRQKYWSALLFSSPGDLPDPGIEPECPASAALAGWFLTTEQPENPYVQDEGPVSFVLNMDIQIPKDCVEKTPLSPLNGLGTLVESQLTVYVRVSFWAIYSISLVCLSFCVPAPWFDHCCLVGCV